MVFGGVGFEGGGGVGTSGGVFGIDGDVGGGVCCVQPTVNALRAMAARMDRLAFMFSLSYRLLINRR